MAATRRARVRALAKINLDLRVLGKRPDGYHELRTIFQTISLSDRLDLAFTPQRTTGVTLDSDIDIPDNLVAKAARLCLEELHRTGSTELRLAKRIPMGAGLGGDPDGTADRDRAGTWQRCTVFPFGRPRGGYRPRD
jgi:4-diphosphocytidyl-2-C-methyl-D-erythritol kinase